MRVNVALLLGLATAVGVMAQAFELPAPTRPSMDDARSAATALLTQARYSKDADVLRLAQGFVSEVVASAETIRSDGEFVLSDRDDLVTDLLSVIGD